METTLHKHGIETELLYLGKRPVAGCIACMKCFETGYCFREDTVKEILAMEGQMAGKLGASVVSCRRGGASATFEQLNQY